MHAQLKELLPFLHDRNPQVRQVALENLVGHTPKGSQFRQIFFENVSGGGLKPKDSDVIRDLKLLCRDQPAIAHDAFKALVNLSDSSLMAPSLSESSFMTFLVSYISNPASVLADLACMLLSNLTAFPVAVNVIVPLEIPLLAVESSSSSTPYYPPSSRSATSPAPVPYPEGNSIPVRALSVLVDAFIDAAKVPSTVLPELAAQKDVSTRKGELHFLASVFANVSVTPAGRLFFITPSLATPLPPPKSTDTEGSILLEYPLSKLVPFTEHPNTMRRGGVDSTIKNCAFHTAAHKAMLASDTELASVSSEAPAPGINILPNILLPLAGPEEVDLDEVELLPTELQFLPDTKKREVDPVLRLTHVETLLLLCTTRKGRVYLREHGVYQIVKFLHLAETDERVAEHVVRLVNFLQRDEGPETAHEGDEFWDEGVTAQNGPFGVSVPVIDDDDDQIVEI